MRASVAEGSFRRACERCGRTIEGPDPAFVCSYASTFCTVCTRVLLWRCPDCGGELARRPRRASDVPLGHEPHRQSPVGSEAVVIVRASVHDLEDGARLFDAYRQFYGQASDLRRARRFLRDRLASGESVVFLARQPGQSVGLAQLYPSFSSIRLGREWILNDLFVVPEARRRGVGSALLARCERWISETGAVGAWLDTAVDNPAQHLYAGRGWKLDREFLRFDWDMDRSVRLPVRRSQRVPGQTRRTTRRNAEA